MTIAHSILPPVKVTTVVEPHRGASSGSLVRGASFGQPRMGSLRREPRP